MGKLCLGRTYTRKATTQWEWRDGESSVYPPWQEAGRWCICALGCESSLVGFGGLDDNPIKGLTSVLSVEQVLNAKQTGFNTSDQV